MADDGHKSGDDTFDCDVLVVGSGAAGLSAAVTAAHSGLKVVISEKGAALRRHHRALRRLVVDSWHLAGARLGHRGKS